MAIQPFLLIRENFQILASKVLKKQLAFTLWFIESKQKTGKLSENGTKILDGVNLIELIRHLLKMVSYDYVLWIFKKCWIEYK